MLIFILAAALALAAFLWSAAGRRPAPPPSTAAPPPAVEAADAERLGEVITLLLAVMDHGELGGPGFLTVQFPQQLFAGSFPTVTAQYPNINEGLYRRVARRELEPGALMAAGMPQDLFAHNPVFSTEGGGVVVLTAEVYGLSPALEKGMGSRRERGELLAALARTLGVRHPELSVRVLGQELLVERAAQSAAAGT